MSWASGGMSCVRVLCQKMRGIPVWAPFGGILWWGFVDTFVMWGCFHPMCQKERGLLFLRPSRVAHVSARHAHHCRSSAGLVSHRFVSYRTAGTAFLEKLFTGFWGFEFWDASVAMGGLIE